MSSLNFYARSTRFVAARRLSVALCAGALLSACAGLAPTPDRPAVAVVPDVCTLPANATDQQRAVAAACVPQPGDRVTPEERRQTVRQLEQPFARLSSQRHRSVLESRSLQAPDELPSRTITEHEPGARERLRIETPGGPSRVIEVIHIGRETWQREEGQPWQRVAQGWGAPAYETVAVLGTVAIVAVTDSSRDGVPVRVLETRAEGSGLVREQRTEVDMARGLIVQMDSVDAGEVLNTLRFDWDAEFAPIEAPKVSAEPAATRG